MNKEDKFLTTSIIAKQFGINERTVRRHIEKKILPATLLHNRQWLIKESDLSVYVENLKKLKTRTSKKVKNL